MKKLITILAALAVSAMFASAADAEKKEATGDAGAKKPSAEAGAPAKKGLTPEERFKKMDTDGDGKLSLDELKAGPIGKKDPAKAEAFLKSHDKDGDGKLTLEEFTSGGKGKKKEK